jgi:hypothetical protein
MTIRKNTLAALVVAAAAVVPTAAASGSAPAEQTAKACAIHAAVAGPTSRLPECQPMLARVRKTKRPAQAHIVTGYYH